jgi:hypothetical protein
MPQGYMLILLQEIKEPWHWSQVDVNFSILSSLANLSASWFSPDDKLSKSYLEKFKDSYNL